MESLFVVYSVAVAVALMAVWGVIIANFVANARRQQRLIPLRERMLRLLLRGGAATDAEMRAEAFGRDKMLTASILSSLAVVTDLSSRNGIARMTRALNLDTLLVSHVRRARGYRQALLLQQLSRIEPRAAVVERIDDLLYSTNRYVRFYAMLSHIAAQPLRSFHLLAALPDALNSFEIAELTSLIFRGGFPVAYAPMLTSAYCNQRLLGLSIVRRIGADETSPQLLRMAASDPESRVARQALYTLSSLNEPISSDYVVQALARISPSERKHLYRHLALHGYSARALADIFNSRERQYFESLVETYKSKLS